MQADQRCEAFTDVRVNLVGAAAEALMGGTDLKPASAASNGTSLQHPPVAIGVAVGDGGDSWNEGDDRALVEALKKCGKELPDRYYGGGSH